MCLLSCFSRVWLFATLWTVVHQALFGILQARVLEWVAKASSRGSSWPTDRTHIPHVSSIADRFFIHWAPWEALIKYISLQFCLLLSVWLAVDICSDIRAGLRKPWDWNAGRLPQISVWLCLVSVTQALTITSLLWGQKQLIPRKGEDSAQLFHMHSPK